MRLLAASRLIARCPFLTIERAATPDGSVARTLAFSLLSTKGG